MSGVTDPVQLHLIWDDPATGEYYESINSLPITIGRAVSLNAIVLNSKQVSRQHARLEDVNGKIIIVDQDSTNGILFNNRRIKCGFLHDGDTFQIPPFTFTVTKMKAEQELLPRKPLATG